MCYNNILYLILTIFHLTDTTSTGQMWGALENLNMISMSILVKQASSTEEVELSSRLMRYSRLAMILTFKSLQPGAENDTLESLLINSERSNYNHNSSNITNNTTGGSSGKAATAVSMNGDSGNEPNQQELLTEEERKWLVAAAPGRCL